MNAPVYTLQNVAKDYAGRRVLEIPSLEIERGEVFGLVGPSGAGKSTLLRLLNFLEPPSEGTIHYRQVPFSADQEPPLQMRRKVTTVFQRPMLLNRSVRANIAFGLRLRGQRDERKDIERVLERVGLFEFANEGARTLSGGEAQRVALARAMVIDPDVLLLDEPTANLDPYNVGLIEEIITELNREQGVTVVLVTHNVFQARRLAHRAALMLEGSLIEVSGVDRFFNQPRDARTAAFVEGRMVY
jgi:tungstate transport system ATP-binding protein